MPRSSRRFVLSSLLFASCFAAEASADWLRFRGPNGTGVSNEAVPTKWDPQQNVKWKMALPGPGSSCPIVVGDRVFVTCWSGYGEERGADPGEQENLLRHLVCVDRNSGDVLWNKSVDPYLPEDEYGGMFAEHGYASHTPVSDGENVYCFFGKSGVIAFNMQGEQLWQKQVGTESGAKNWGTASSPILYENLVIVPATAESEALVALDKKTGKQIWKQEAAGFNSTWGSPVLVRVDSERSDLVIGVPDEIWALNPATGKLAWYCQGVPASSMCSSVVAHGDTVYAVESGPGGGGGIAVKVGGAKDVTDSHVVWQGNQSNRIGTPVYSDGRLFMVANKVLTVLDAETGDNVTRLRLSSDSKTAAPAEEANTERRGFGRGRGGRGGRGGGQDYASAVIANGNLYFQTRGGEMFVVQLGDEPKQIASNRVTNDTEDFSATPAVSHGCLFIRSNKHLYCVSE